MQSRQVSRWKAQNIVFCVADMCRIEYVIFLMFWYILVTIGKIVHNDDICGPRNGRRLYLEMGEKGILYAKNVTFTKTSSRQQIPHLYDAKNSSHHQCSLGLVTCPSCIIIVIFKNISLSHHYDDGSTMTNRNSCRGDYVWVSEPPYEDISVTSFCGSYSPITYRSNTRIVSINLLYSQSYEDAFTIEYKAERNRVHLTSTEMGCGSSINDTNSTVCNVLTSPFFPARYPRDLSLEYIITCPNETLACRIRLLFSDFQLAVVSIMEFYEWNGQRLDISSGARARPSIIVSSGPSLLIRFNANGGTNLGYKALYSFVSDYMFDKFIQPVTDCGGYIENLGGTITMINMIDHGIKTYDCVWLIRSHSNYLHAKTYIYLKVMDFTNMAGNTELTIKQGPILSSIPLEIIKYPMSRLQLFKYKEHIAPASDEFYVSLRGTFDSNSHLAIAYSAFNYIDCFGKTDFLCQNHRCISNQLKCDGFDHCGDNSDEPTTCFHDWNMQPFYRKWSMNKANYYFPKINQNPDLSTAILLFGATSLGLIVLISALVILLYRIRAKSRQQRELQSRLETISELLDSARMNEITISSIDDPPVYEAPPGYEEVTKLALQEQTGNLNHEICSRNSSSRYNDENTNFPTYLVVQDTSNSDGQTASASVVSSNRPFCIPSSPPPPYITSSEIQNVNRADISTSIYPRVRHTCLLRCSPQFPQSPFTGLLSADDQSCSSIDALGVYHGDYADPSIICRIKNQLGDVEMIGKTVQENTAMQILIDDNQRVILERNNNEIVNRIISGSVRRNLNCSCEGACGCATNNSDLRNHLIDNLLNPTTVQIDDCESDEIESFLVRNTTDEHRYEEKDDLVINKNAIIRLLGSKLTKPSRSGVNLISTSSSFNTLCSFSKTFSTRSADDCLTKLAAISKCRSYEKLQNEIETNISRKTTNPNMIINTSNVTPNLILSQLDRDCTRRHSSCDLDSLYKDNKVPESYLMQRNH